MADYPVELKRYNSSVWDILYPATTIAQVIGLSTALTGKLSTTATAADSHKVDGLHVAFDQAGTDANTLYFRSS